MERDGGIFGRERALFERRPKSDFGKYPSSGETHSLKSSMSRLNVLGSKRLDTELKPYNSTTAKNKPNTSVQDDTTRVIAMQRSHPRLKGFFNKASSRTVRYDGQVRSFEACGDDPYFLELQKILHREISECDPETK
mmetsp:Transcript_1415/g.2575  ORF Transcript_1415/g.2575 Transcript_1415/m.2575 type:complete len:137 (-) Transcript_1415:81-491(-)